MLLILLIILLLLLLTKPPLLLLVLPLRMLCWCSGVVSRIEVVEYTHSGRGLLALQVRRQGTIRGSVLCRLGGAQK